MLHLVFFLVLHKNIMNFKKQYFLLRDKANGEVTILISFMGSFLKLVFMTIKPKLNN